MKVSEVMRLVPRQQFVLEQHKLKAWQYDQALPIGHEQTISQPATVRNMLEWLDVKAGMKVLDVGSGSGWTTALLARLVGEGGFVYAVERIPELVRFGRKNCYTYGASNVRFYRAGRRLGLPRRAPFDRILVSASADVIPDELVSQLAPGGKMVIPVRESILEVTKDRSGKLETTAHHGYIFVPLVEESSDPTQASGYPLA